LADLGCSLGHIHPFTLHPCRWDIHPHRVLKRFIETKVPSGTPDAVIAQTGTEKKKITGVEILQQTEEYKKKLLMIA
jgi:hypothetical protein